MLVHILDLKQMLVTESQQQGKNHLLCNKYNLGKRIQNTRKYHVTILAHGFYVNC
jgi:tmRNA-binding protein